MKTLFPSFFCETVFTMGDSGNDSNDDQTESDVVMAVAIILASVAVAVLFGVMVTLAVRRNKLLRTGLITYDNKGDEAQLFGATVTY